MIFLFLNDYCGSLLGYATVSYSNTGIKQSDSIIYRLFLYDF